MPENSQILKFVTKPYITSKLIIIEIYESFHLSRRIQDVTWLSDAFAS